jgi:trimeric autotransporter adhesin
VIFHGAIASIVATLAKPVIGTSASTADVITAIAYDKDGTVVQTGNLFANSGTTTVAASVGSTAITAGVAKFALTGLVAGTTAITVANAATAATVSATAVTVRVGSSTPASITVSLDKASYAPGEAVTASISVLDASGLAVADGVYNNIFATGGISANYTIAGWSETTTVTTVAGVGTRTGYLPSTEGDVTFKWTTGTNLATANQAKAGTPIVVSVSSPAAAAATDAANEARDAADAATDAALQAAEAADAATVAAQEASDAVAALSESVTALVAGLQAQIKSLAAVLARIAKKVKA